VHVTLRAGNNWNITRN